MTNEEFEELLEYFNRNLKYKYSNNNIKSSYHNYNYKNWLFQLKEDRLKGSGSLTKLYFGDNIQNASFEEIKIAIKEIESLITIPLDDANITRIDIASTINVREKPSKYLQYMVTPAGFKLSMNGDFETINFKGTNLTYSFYDKNLEAHTKKKYRELCKQDNYKLRYELQIDKQIGKALNRSNLIWSDLSNKEIYLQLINFWYISFQEVPIICQESLLDLNIINLKKLKYDLELHGIMKFGGVEVVRQALKGAIIHKATRFRINEYLSHIELPVFDKNLLKTELDLKINQMYEQSRR